MLCLVGGILTPALLGGNDCNLRTPKLFHTEFKPKSGKDNLHTLYFNQQQRAATRHKTVDSVTTQSALIPVQSVNLFVVVSRLCFWAARVRTGSSVWILRDVLI